jgi:hypothetical protein
MCQRIIVPRLQIGGISGRQLQEKAVNKYPNIARHFLPGQVPQIETVELVGLRCCKYKLTGVVPCKEFFDLALADGFDLCPSYLPFHYVIQEGLGNEECFVFASESRRAQQPGQERSVSNVFLAVHHFHGFDYAMNVPYGSGIEFAFIRRLQ